MEYRELEKLGIKTSLLGFGCMRFPKHRNGKVNEDKAEEMLDTAYKNGVNYFDTAYIYHDGESERITGHILNKYDRTSYYLATKLPVWLVQTLEDAKRIFEDQLKRLDKDYIDFYLLHALNRNEFDRIAKLGVIEYCEELKAAGKIKYFGFSFHDAYDAFEVIIKAHNWDFCQIQYNYIDENEQAGTKGYELAESLGIPMVIMEPVKGGALANLPDSFTEIFKKVNPESSNASWALRWVASHPNVKVVLSGMSTFEQVTDNLKTFENFKTFALALHISKQVRNTAIQILRRQS
ncbi:MAG: aldo/keto reductase [Clostridiales bacterium]|nr:aldo/keto reductase [Clostridiales bacterium]